MKKKKTSVLFPLPAPTGSKKDILVLDETLMATRKSSATSVEQDTYAATSILTKSRTTTRTSSKTSGFQLNGTDGADSLAGGSGADTLNGAGGNDMLFGGNGSDRLNGGFGDDVLNGGTGYDTMAGGAGNDRYIVDTARDIITELASEGTDTVEASVSWSLGSNIENLTLTGTANLNGTGNTLNNHLMGNSGSNLLQGGAGHDTLDGGANAAGAIDTLAGGTGDDLYLVRSSTEVVRENAGEGTDTVHASVSHTLAANVENLVLTGAGALDGAGNDLANRITGSAGANLLQGMGGNDTILGGDGADTVDGGAGNDQLTGGTGADLFRFIKAGGQDAITDFNAAEGDMIDLTGTGITGLAQLQITSDSGGYVIGLGDGSTITLSGNTAPQASWFKFDPAPVDSGEAPTNPLPPVDTLEPADGQLFSWEGISLPSYWGGSFQTTGGLSAMDQVKETGANTITVVPTCFMADKYSNEVKLHLSSDPNTPWMSESDTFEQVKQGVADAVAKGLKVVVKPHMETPNRDWRATIEPTDPKLWFASYKAMIVEYAKAAQAGGASMFSIGCELQSMTDPTKVCSDGMTYTQKWEDIIDAVREVFTGQVTYSSTDVEIAQVQFWDKLDYIGVNPYFPMTESNSPTVEQLIDAWVKPSTVWYTNHIHKGLSAVDYYKSFAEQWGKKVIFTEIGYQSEDGANKDPGAMPFTGNVDLQEQKDCYEALYHVLKNYSGQWLDGAFLWSYQTNLDPVYIPGTDYTTQGKPANEVITEGYSSPAHVTGIAWNGTEGTDKLDGGYNNDTLDGGAGDDVLWGGAGHDVISGGLGADRFEFGTKSGNDTVTDFDVALAGEVIAITSNVNGLNLTSFEQLMARTTMVGADAVIDLGGGNMLKLAGIDKAMLSANDFLFI